MLIDTHAHLNFTAFKEDLNEVIKKSLDNDIWVINVGSQYTTSKRAVEIAQKYEGIYAAVGLHPIHLNTGLVKIKADPEEIQFNSKEEEFGYEEYRDLAKNEKVVAIGEIGFDYYYKPKTKRKLELFKEKQKEVFSQQLKLAKELNLPVIFHCRMAHRDLLAFLKENPALKPEKAVAHGFVGNSEELRGYLDFGYHIGFNGIIFKDIKGIKLNDSKAVISTRFLPSLVFEENIKNTPLDRVLLETDCPYLTPPQKEGRNEPIYVKYVAEEIAKIKNLGYEEISKITTENAKKLFNI